MSHVQQGLTVPPGEVLSQAEAFQSLKWETLGHVIYVELLIQGRSAKTTKAGFTMGCSLSSASFRNRIIRKEIAEMDLCLDQINVVCHNQGKGQTPKKKFLTAGGECLKPECLCNSPMERIIGI